MFDLYRLFKNSLIVLCLLIFFVTNTYSKEIQLTEDEVSWLKSKKSLVFANVTTFPPFSFYTDGKPAGYSVEYARLIGKVLNKEIEFYTGPWGELLTALKDGRLDVVPHIAVTEERKKYVDYTDFNHIEYTTGFAVRKGDRIESVDDLQNKIVAVTKKTFLHGFMKKNFPNIKLYETDSTNMGILAVSEDKADAVIGNMPSLSFFIQQEWKSNLKVVSVPNIGLPEKTKLPMGVRKGNDQLRSILEKVNDCMPSNEVRALKQKWIFSESAVKRDLSFSNDELTFLEKHKIIRFRVRSDRPPFEFTENGFPTGIAVDYVREIAKFAGFTAEFVIDNRSINDAFEVVEGNRDAFDTLLFSVRSSGREKRVAFGDDYLTYPMMVLGHKDAHYISKVADLKGKRVAIESGFLTNKWLKRDYPEIIIVPAESTQHALMMVQNKLVDAYIGNIAIANYMAAHGEIKDVKIVAPSDYGNIKYSFVAPKDWGELATIMSKSYRSLPVETHDSLRQKWFSVQVVDKTDYTIIWKVIGVSISIGLWILWWNRRLLRAKKATEKALAELHETKDLLEIKNAQLEELSTTDRLTRISNRLKLDSVLSAEFERSKRYGGSFGVILADIDYFKNVNDTFGHQVGDEVLVRVAAIFKENIRSVDTVGRWGGEEFLIICPETTESGVKNVSEHLRELVESEDFGEVGRITVSFGASLYQDGVSIEKIISNADAALYSSKEKGRNLVSFK